jgi:SNF2 family DNA or RNA helicase
LGRRLRPHQKEGVQFLYDCVMGVTNPSHTGAILGDEMGLGKTVQTICLIWTLLKSGPRHRPCVSKAIIVVCFILVSFFSLPRLLSFLGTSS